MPRPRFSSDTERPNGCLAKLPPAHREQLEAWLASSLSLSEIVRLMESRFRVAVTKGTLSRYWHANTARMFCMGGSSTRKTDPRIKGETLAAWLASPATAAEVRQLIAQDFGEDVPEEMIASYRQRKTPSAMPSAPTARSEPSEAATVAAVVRRQGEAVTLELNLPGLGAIRLEFTPAAGVALALSLPTVAASGTRKRRRRRRVARDSSGAFPA